ncbi:MAG: hypothetical protein AB2L24_11665 [Mangrovibacterium sp.]
MKEIKAFKCEYCGKHTTSKSYIKAHEKKCFHNPATRSCVTCWYWTPVMEKQERDGITVNVVKEMTCKKGVLFEKRNNRQIFKTNCPNYAEMFNDPMDQPTIKDERRKLRKESRRLNQVAKLYALTKAYDCFTKKRLYASVASQPNDYRGAERTADLANFFFHGRGIEAKPTDFLHDVNEMADKAVSLLCDYNHMLDLVDEGKSVTGLNSKTVDAFCKAVEYGYHTESGYRYKCIILKTIGHVQYPAILGACISYMSGDINILQFRHMFQWVGFSMKLEPINIRSFARQINEIDSLYREIEQKQMNRVCNHITD